MAQLYFYYSAMNAGKSTALLQSSSYNYRERGMRTVVYTAEIDDRFGAGEVSSAYRFVIACKNYLTKIHHYLMRFVRNMNSRQFIAYWLMNASFNQTTSI